MAPFSSIVLSVTALGVWAYVTYWVACLAVRHGMGDHADRLPSRRE